MAVFNPKSGRVELEPYTRSAKENLSYLFAVSLTVAYFLFAVILLSPRSISLLNRSMDVVEAFDLIPQKSFKAVSTKNLANLTFPTQYPKRPSNLSPSQGADGEEVMPSAEVKIEMAEEFNPSKAQHEQVEATASIDETTTNTTSTQNILDLDLEPSLESNDRLGTLSLSEELTTDVSSHEKTTTTSLAAPRTSNTSSPPDHLTAAHHPEIPTYDRFKQMVAQEQKPYLLKFGADWCMPCKLMEETTFQDATLIALLDAHFLLFSINIEDFDGYNLKQLFKVDRVPTMLFFDAQGNLVKRNTGTMTALQLIDELETLLQKPSDLLSAQADDEEDVEDFSRFDQQLEGTSAVNER